MSGATTPCSSRARLRCQAQAQHRGHAVVEQVIADAAEPPTEKHRGRSGQTGGLITPNRTSTAKIHKYNENDHSNPVGGFGIRGATRGALTGFCNRSATRTGISSQVVHRVVNVR